MPTWIASLISGGWLYLAAALMSFGGGIATAVYIERNAYEHQIDSLKLQISNQDKMNTEAALNQLQGFIGNMNAASHDYQTSLDSINGKFVIIAKEFKNATAKPLPVDCVPDDSRMHTLTSAIATTNAKDTAP